MRVLVTGGAGFIGSHLVRALLLAGREVVVLDDLSSGTREAVPEGARLVVGRVQDPAAVGEVIDGCEAICHLAARPSVVESVRLRGLNVDVSARGTTMLLEAARLRGVRRLVLASSCAVYGDMSGKIREIAPPAPRSPYAAGKVAAEAVCSAWSALGWVSCCSLRLFNVYGPGQRGDTEYGAVVPRFVAAVRGDVEAIVYGDGKQTRSFVHIDDVVRAFLLALDSDVTGPLNIAGNVLSVLGLLDVLGDIRGRPVRRRHEAPRRGDIRMSIGVSARAWDALRWAPRILLSDGLRGLLGDEGGAVVG